MIKVLHLANGYPTVTHPEYCVFTKEQINSLNQFDDIKSQLYFINARENGKLEYFKALYRLPKILKEVDVIHCFHGLTLLLVVCLTKKPILVSFLNSIDNEYGLKNTLFSKIFRNLTLRAIKRKNVFKIFKDKIPKEHKERSFYLPNGVDLNKFYPIDKDLAKKEIGLDISKRYVLFVSSKNIDRPQKRYDKFKKVMLLLKKEYDNIEELTLVNEPREKIIYYFNACEFHLLTSDYEGSPNSVKEALSCNTAVVSTNVGNVSDILLGIGKSEMVLNDSIENLYEASCRLLNDIDNSTEIREQIKKKGLDMDSKAKELVSLYKTINKK